VFCVGISELLQESTQELSRAIVAIF